MSARLIIERWSFDEFFPLIECWEFDESMTTNDPPSQITPTLIVEIELKLNWTVKPRLNGSVNNLLLSSPCAYIPINNTLFKPFFDYTNASFVGEFFMACNANSDVMNIKDQIACDD